VLLVDKSVALVDVGGDEDADPWDTELAIGGHWVELFEQPAFPRELSSVLGEMGFLSGWLTDASEPCGPVNFEEGLGSSLSGERQTRRLRC
jgi:hypothetical protein